MILAIIEYLMLFVGDNFAFSSEKFNCKHSNFTPLFTFCFMIHFYSSLKNNSVIAYTLSNRYQLIINQMIE